MGKPKNKKEPKKQKASKNSVCNSSSAQKENMPKNEKTRTSMKPSPSDGIAMSKQLLLKKNIARTQRRASTKPQRICPNGKPIPSLAELEKMFEDSDDDDPTPKTPKTQTATCTTSTPVKQTPSNMNEKLQLSPTTIDKITERLLGSIQKQDLPDPSELLEASSLLREKTPPPPSVIPPKKRKKPDVPYIVGCKDRPKVISKPSTNFCKGNDDYGVDGLDENPDDQIPTKRAKKSRIPNYSKSIFNAHSDEIAERLINDDAGDLSDASSDSNKTIEYDPTLFQNPRPHSFSPTPSTSTNSVVIRQNDDLFNKSFKEINSTKNIDEQIIPKSSPEEKEENVQIENETTPKKKGDLPTTIQPSLKNEDDLQVIDNPYDTIVIDDNCEITADIQDTKNTVDANVIEIIEPSAEVIRPKKEIINNVIPNDDDCMIVASSKINNPQSLNEPIIIDDEYSSINTEFDSLHSLHNETFEVIDVDDIIAENKSLLDKWKTSGVNKLKKINTVNYVPHKYRVVTPVHIVDIPNLSQATQNMQPPNTQQPAVIPNTSLQSNNPSLSQATQNMQTPNTQQPAVIPNTTLQSNIPSLSQATENMQPPNTQQPAVIPNTTLQSNIPSLSQATENMQTPNTQQPAVIPNTTLQSNKPPSPNKSSYLGSNSSVTIIRSNKKGGTVVSECPKYGFQRILDDFFNNIERHSKNFTLSTDKETAKVLNELCKFGRVIETDENISTPTPPVNTTTHTSAETSQDRADKRRKHDALMNFLKKGEFTTIKQPSLIPTRNIGDCPICLDVLSSCNGIASTICGHVFCLKCIRAAVKTNGKRCPTCRKVLKGVGGGYHQIFL